MPKRLTLEEFIKRCKEIHPEYSYEKSIYDRANNPVIVTCPIHGDFYLPDCNTFIEYNGMQHYVPIKYFGGELKFKEQQERDDYVRNYCKENNIKLIEIKYNDNVYSILEQYLG